MEKKIVVAGHISVDITPVFQSSKKKSISQVLCPGKLIRTGEAVVYTGGVVSNTGLALHKMGANVRLAGKIGKDALGEMMLAMMKQHGTEKTSSSMKMWTLPTRLSLHRRELTGFSFMDRGQ